MEHTTMLERYHQRIATTTKYIRIMRGFTQTEVGLALGVSFQQIQKYEKGSNRISAGTIAALSCLFRVHPSSFFAGINADQIDPIDEDTEQHIHQLIRHFRNTSSPQAKELILATAKICAELSKDL